MKRTLAPLRNIALLGLTCAWAAGFNTPAYAQRVPNGTNQIAFADFDLAIPGWDYGYFYSDGNIGGTYTQSRSYADPPDFTNTVFCYTFDSSVYAGFSSWWGTGFGMPLPWNYDPMAFTSVDPADYILSFDARVEGLAAGQATADCRMEFRLGVGTTWAMVKALPYAPGSNWTHYVFNLGEGSYISADGQPNTSYTTFTNGIATGLSEVRFNQNQPEPTEFGADADNAIYLDNIKFEVLQYQGPPPPPPPVQALPVYDYNFDDKPVWYTWNAFPGGTGWADGGGTRAYYWAEIGAGMGVSNSQAYVMGMDNTLMAGGTRPTWAGGNTGAGGQADYSVVTSSSMKDYQINFAARVEGLAPGAETTPITVQLYFRAPDDTLQPPDSDTDLDVLLRHNIDVSGISSNWQTFVVSLNDGSVNAGSLANLKTHLSQVSQIDFQIQIQNSHQDQVWAYDADNRVFVDDFKLERLIVGTPPLTISPAGNNVVISWAAPATGSVKLLSGTTLNNITNEIAGATSPHTNAVSAAPKYYRTLWVPPTP